MRYFAGSEPVFDRDKFVADVARWMEHNNITRTQLAVRASLNEPTLRSLLTGKVQFPTVELVARLVAVCGLDFYAYYINQPIESQIKDAASFGGFDPYRAALPRSRGPFGISERAAMDGAAGVTNGEEQRPGALRRFWRWLRRLLRRIGAKLHLVKSDGSGVARGPAAD